MTPRTILIAVVIVAIAVLLYFGFADESSQNPQIMTAPTDFVEVGTITAGNPGQKENVLYLIYENPGAPALSKELTFDGSSFCVIRSGAVSCAGMSPTFAEKRAIVEGNVQGDAVLVRKLYVLAEGQLPLAPGPGRIFISWPQAIGLIKNCQIEMVTQTHSLDVILDLKNGQTVVTVEPVIDELFTVIQEAQATCGSFPIATE